MTGLSLNCVRQVQVRSTCFVGCRRKSGRSERRSGLQGGVYVEDQAK